MRRVPAGENCVSVKQRRNCGRDSRRYTNQGGSARLKLVIDSPTAR
jgi:hypothetical protein